MPPVASKPNNDGFLVNLLVSMISPGVAPEAVKVVYFALGGLILTGFALAAITGGNIHVLIMLSLALALLISFTWFMANLKPTTSPPNYFDEEPEKAKKKTTKKKKVAAIAPRVTASGGSFKNEQREPEATEIELPRTLGVKAGASKTAAGKSKAPTVPAGKAPARKKVPAPAPVIDEVDGWRVNVTKAQKQKEKRKAHPAADEAAALQASEVAAPAAAVVEGAN